MGLVKQQRNGTTYLYESTSYYDAEKKQSRSKRKLLGKIDEETGELVPTGKRGRKKQDTQAPKSGRKKSEKDSGNPSENSTASDIEKEFSDRIETQEKEIILLKKRIDILETAEAIMYGKKQEISYYCVDLILRFGFYFDLDMVRKPVAITETHVLKSLIFKFSILSKPRHRGKLPLSNGGADDGR